MAKIFSRRRPRSSSPDRTTSPGHHRAETVAASTVTVTVSAAGMGIKVHQPYRDAAATDGTNDVTREKLGTMAYTAPEVRLGLPYSYGVDFWSLGVLLYVMLTGRVSFFFFSLSLSTSFFAHKQSLTDSHETRPPLPLQFPFGPLGEYHCNRFEPLEVDEGAQALLERVRSLRLCCGRRLSWLTPELSLDRCWTSTRPNARALTSSRHTTSFRPSTGSPSPRALNRHPSHPAYPRLLPRPKPYVSLSAHRTMWLLLRPSIRCHTSHSPRHVFGICVAS
jgi:serine/threonine protein kinase